MVKTKTKPKIKKEKKIEEDEEENSGGVSLDDAFADDEGVTYAESKPKKKKEETEDDEDEEEGVSQSVEVTEHIIKNSKPFEQVKKGDKIKIDGKEYEVDTQSILMDHKVTKEMAIEVFDPKSEKEFQVRYFTGRLDVVDPELYELVNDFMYVKRFYKKIEF